MRVPFRRYSPLSLRVSYKSRFRVYNEIEPLYPIFFVVHSGSFSFDPSSIIRGNKAGGVGGEGSVN